MRRLVPFSLTSFALAAVLLGCGPLPEPFPPGTSGTFCGTTTGGTSGTTSGSSGTSGTVCAEIACAQGCGFVPVPEGSCPVCACPATCTTNADCPRGDYCDFAADANPESDYSLKGAAAGQCKPVQVCPAMACAIDDPTQVCTTGTDANGCPTCSCQPASTACQGNADCPSGDVCVNACPCTGAGPCPDCASLTGTCQAAPPPPYCVSDANCAIGTTCQPSPVQPCPAGEACNTVIADECLPAPTCSSSSDCQTGEICGPNPADPCNGPAQTCNVVLPNICQVPPTN